MVLVSLLAGFVANVIYYETNVYTVVANEKMALQSVRITAEMMSRDLREIMAPDSIFQASEDSIRFDRVGDQLVRYEHVGNRILRNGNVLLEGVSTFEFRYYNKLGSPLSSPVADPKEIRRVVFSLTAQVGNRPVSSKMSITPRNW